MKNKFLYLVSMKVTPEQKEYLKGELEKLGYEWYSQPSTDENKYLYINSFNRNGKMQDCTIIWNYHNHIPSYNPKLFLALAAQRENGGDGCWYINDIVMKLVQKQKGKHLPNASYYLATKEELIAHFTKPKEMTPSKEIQIERAKDSVEYHKKKLEKWEKTLAKLEQEQQLNYTVEGVCSQVAATNNSLKNEELYKILRKCCNWANGGSYNGVEFVVYINDDNKIDFYRFNKQSPFRFHSESAMLKFLSIEGIEELLKQFYDTL